ncbi:MAG TPA: hypothetical protein VHM20_03810 [Gammaproteobacteria bacterium]|jgi:hypothetical protein|nr:hypothetical protein [Gammaproteobacteria bacterium]
MMRCFANFFKCTRTIDEPLLDTTPKQLLKDLNKEIHYRQRYFSILTLLSGALSFTTSILGVSLLTKHLRHKISSITKEINTRANSDNWNDAGYECSTTIIDTFNTEYPANSSDNLNMCFNWMNEAARNQLDALLSTECAAYCKYLRSLTLSQEGHQAFLYFFLPLAALLLVKKEAQYFFSTFKYYYHYSENARLTDLSPELFGKITQFLQEITLDTDIMTLKELQNILQEEVEEHRIEIKNSIN